jgi:hypothetical protein
MKLHSNSINPRLLPIWGGILLTCALSPVWYRWANAPPPYTADYATGFIIFIPIVWTIGWWFMLGLPGLKTLLRNKQYRLWLLLLILLVLWVFLSTEWAYIRSTRPEVATGTAIQFALVAVFSLAVICAGPPPYWIVQTLVIAMLIYGCLGALQVTHQGSIGLEVLGEFDLNPQRSGTSIIQVGEIRWLRPYGLASHSNIFAGFIAVGALAALALIFTSKSYLRWLATVAFWFGLWVLFLTFSRAAWLGFAVGTGCILWFVQRHLPDRKFRRYGWFTLGVAAGLGLLFVILYHPFLLVRTGGGERVESTETRSIEDRALFMQIAFEASKEYPIQGVGSGNYPWYASHYLFYRLKTNQRVVNVHNVYVLIQSELGIVGLSLTGLLFVLGLWLSGKRAPYDPYSIGLIAGFCALAVIGLFDHYPWTQVHFQVLWWGLLAASMNLSPVNE